MVRCFLIFSVVLLISGCGGGGEGSRSVSTLITARSDLEKSLIAPPTLLMLQDALISNQNCLQDITYSGEIVVKTGIYCFNGLKYNLSTEGLFRIFDFQNKQSRQIIVYERDIYRLLSSFAWVVKHGSADDSLYSENPADLRKKLVNSSLSMTCGPISGFFGNFLKELGIESRLVGFSRDSNFNGFDDGHVLLEIKIGSKWSAVDLDNNYIFMTPDLQTVSALQISIEPRYLEGLLRIADDEGDVVNFRDGALNYGFYTESQQLDIWYRQIMRVVSIDGTYFCPEYRDCASFQRNNPSLKLVSQLEFIKLFYADE